MTCRTKSTPYQYVKLTLKTNLFVKILEGVYLNDMPNLNGKKI